MEPNSNNLLERVATHLIIQSPFITNNGLFHGKTGIAYAMYHYASYSKDTSFINFADELIDQICSSIDEESTINLENGLCGIAWGLCDLVENGFLAGNLNQALAEIDEKIAECSPMRIKDLSIRTGVAGIWIYVQKRLEMSQKAIYPQSFDTLFLEEMKRTEIPNKVNSSTKLLLNSIVFPKRLSQRNFSNFPLGLDNGCSNILLRKATI